LKRGSSITQGEGDSRRTVADEEICSQNDIDRHHHQLDYILPSPAADHIPDIPYQSIVAMAQRIGAIPAK